MKPDPAVLGCGRSTSAPLLAPITNPGGAVDRAARRLARLTNQGSTPARNWHQTRPSDESAARRTTRVGIPNEQDGPDRAAGRSEPRPGRVETDRKRDAEHR